MSDKTGVIKEVILAGIVSYNPDLERLADNIYSIKPQVDKVLIIDNASKNVKEVLKFQESKVEVICNHSNLGIATALNQILKYASALGYEYFISLDQDSVAYQGLITMYMKYTGIERAAAFTCLIKDISLEANGYKEDGSTVFVKNCISSGCMYKTSVINEIGGFNDKLFIDMVDIELCKRINRRGYQIVKVNTLGLLHELGKSESKKIFNRTISVFHEKTVRHYYISRNLVYLYRHYNEKQILWYLTDLFLKMLFFEKDKLKKIKAWLLGGYDGLREKMGKCEWKL